MTQKTKEKKTDSLAVALKFYENMPRNYYASTTALKGKTSNTVIKELKK